MALTLVIGNKNYSSWSMRPWMALKGGQIPFNEIVIPLYTGEADKKRILSFTQSRKGPALIDGPPPRCIPASPPCAANAA